jgi:8-oxo-dGTP pyrophosphatase MutT (NUDIX family)
VSRAPLHRRLLGRRLLRLGYRLVAAAAHAWWTLRGSRNHGAKCVLFNGGDVLLVRHTYGDRRSWDFPGGFVRRHEDPAATARRELCEELGVDLPGLADLGSLVVEIGRRSDTVHYFHGQLADRRLAPDDVELAAVEWFAPAALPPDLGDHVVEVLGRLAAHGLARPRLAPER